MQITTKQVKANEFETETRFFAKTDDRFDGTAQGYGYKSIEKLNKAYWFYKNKGKLKKLEHEAKKFLKENLGIKKLLNEYFSDDNLLYALKDRRKISFDTLLAELKDSPIENRDIIDKIESVKHLWNSMMYVREC